MRDKEFRVFGSMTLMELPLDDTRTLLEIYDSIPIDPDKTAIVMALVEGMRIPISRQYDNDSLVYALQQIAITLRDQKPQKSI